jgi:hypothetical protein
MYEWGVNDKYRNGQWRSKVNRQRRCFVNDKSTYLLKKIVYIY